MKKRMITSLTLLLFLCFGINQKNAEASAQGAYIKDGSMVQVTKKNYDMWQNFGWKYKNNTTNVYNKTFEARGRYKHRNGQTYYSLFDSNGKWQGYLNSNATKKTGRQGSYISDGSYVKISKNNYNMWKNFGWKYKNNTSNIYGQTFQARGRFQHFNGATYYSLYDKNGLWYGYLNATATQKTKPEGNYIADGRYIKVAKKNYGIWQNFGWKKRNNSSDFYNQSLLARGRYEHFNGESYYSLFDSKGTWVGYLNTSATELYKPQNKKVYKVINKDTKGKIIKSTKGYDYVSESNDGGVITSTAPNGDTVTTITTTKVWKKRASTEVVPVSPLGNSGILAQTLAEAGAQGSAMHNDPKSPYYHGNPVDGNWDKGYAFKTIQVKMSDGSKWYSVEFYVIDL